MIILICLWIRFLKLNFFFWENFRFTCSCKNNTEIPWALYQIPPVVTSSKTVVHCHSKDVGINTAKIQDISITLTLPFYSHTHVYSVPTPSLTPTTTNLSIPKFCHFKNVI